MDDLRTVTNNRELLHYTLLHYTGGAKDLLALNQYDLFDLLAPPFFNK